MRGITVDSDLNLDITIMRYTYHIHSRFQKPFARWRYRIYLGKVCILMIETYPWMNWMFLASVDNSRLMQASITKSSCSGPIISALPPNFSSSGSPLKEHRTHYTCLKQMSIYWSHQQAQHWSHDSSLEPSSRRSSPRTRPRSGTTAYSEICPTCLLDWRNVLHCKRSLQSR